jgi:predicted metal-dependent phosphoesterase TrpH
MTPLINVDFHCHTVVSNDSDIKLNCLIQECDLKGITKLAITDHNRIDGALEAATRWPARIIPGLEIMTSQGELLAYYVTEPVEQGLSPMETIQALKAQGAILSISHPFDRWRNGGWKIKRLMEILPYLDAIEIFNGHCLSGVPNNKAQVFANRFHLPGTAGSDAHYISEIGLAGLTLEDFQDPQGLRLALHSAQVFGKRIPPGTRMTNWLKHARQ